MNEPIFSSVHHLQRPYTIAIRQQWLSPGVYNLMLFNFYFFISQHKPGNILCTIPATIHAFILRQLNRLLFNSNTTGLDDMGIKLVKFNIIAPHITSICNASISTSILLSLSQIYGRGPEWFRSSGVETRMIVTTPGQFPSFPFCLRS